MTTTLQQGCRLWAGPIAPVGCETYDCATGVVTRGRMDKVIEGKLADRLVVGTPPMIWQAGATPAWGVAMPCP
ncbi:MAG: hypothetical protein AAGE03_05170 [Pseudomonadota bacterium]